MFRMQTFLMRENVPDKILISRMEMDFKKRSVKSAESEVANDDWTQEFNEMTLDC